jgi:hypothetical protein
MAQFKDVFSTTAKVILSLLIISAVVGLGFLILGRLGSAITPASSASADPNENEADALRAAMPKSAWDNLIAKAVANHCVTDGMNEEEVFRAVGEPNLKYDGKEISTWTWHPAKPNETTLFFTGKGNVYLWSSGCKTLAGSVTP